MNSGDVVATALAGLTLEATYATAEVVLEIPVASLQNGYEATAKTEDSPAVKAFKGYGHLNLGMQRMSLGNKIRGAINKAEGDELLEYLVSYTDSLREEETAHAVAIASDEEDEGEGNAAD